mgnify:CR=1 FL=1
MKVPFDILALDHVVLRVRHLDQSLRFYRDILGCPVEKVQENFGLYQLRAGQSLIDLVDINGPLGRKGGAPAGPEGRNMDHLALEISGFDIDELTSYLTAHAVKIGDYGRRYGARGYGPSLYIEDPDGNIVELKGPPESNR